MDVSWNRFGQSASTLVMSSGDAMSVDERLRLIERNLAVRETRGDEAVVARQCDSAIPCACILTVCSMT